MKTMTDAAMIASYNPKITSVLNFWLASCPQDV